MVPPWCLVGMCTCIVQPMIHWGKPERAPHKRYICMQIMYYMVRRSCEVYAQHDSVDISTKYFIVHSHTWATGHIIIRCSNLANCRFTPVLSVRTV